MSTRRERDDLSDQLYQQLKESIVLGVIGPSDALPTIAESAEKLGVAVRTVQTAYGKLADEGLTESNRSLGTTVKKPKREAYCDVAELYLARAIEELRRLGLHGDEAKKVFEKLWHQPARLERETLADYVCLLLKRAAVIGVYRPGGRPFPTVSEAARKYRVSNTVASEAYERLESEGLIEIGRAGITVKKAKRQFFCDVAEIYLSRAVEELCDLDLHPNEAERTFDRLWHQWYGVRQGERRGSGDIRAMDIDHVREERRAGGERRYTKR